MKFLRMCLIVSVDSTVDIPNLEPNNEARVDFPVPDVPANKMMIFLLASINRIKGINRYKLNQKQYKSL